MCIFQALRTTLNSAYNEKKYAEILLRYRWLFVKGDLFIGEQVYLVRRYCFVIGDFSLKGDFVIGGVECT